MRRASTTPGWRVLARRARWLAPLLTVGALVVAAPASTVAAHAASGATHDATAHHTRRFTTVGTNAVVTDRAEHRDVPTGWVPVLPGAAVLGAVGAVALVHRRARTVRVRTAFRRRAPPLLPAIA